MTITGSFKRTIVTGVSGTVTYGSCELLGSRGHRVAGAMRSLGGNKPFCVIADRSGMGDAIVGYNEPLGKVTRGLYAANGMENMSNLNAGQS